MKPSSGSWRVLRKIAAALQAWGPGGAFLLALLDSAAVPLPGGVDALLVLTAITNPDLAYLTAAVCVVGSAIGSMILYSIARKGGEIYLERHTQTARARRFRDWFGAYGLVTVFIPTLVPIPGLPMKVFVLSAGALGVRPMAFLLTVLAGRVPRYFALAALGRALGDDAPGWISAHKWHLVLGALVLGALLMLLVRVARSSGRL
jgi:membrane protein YqaA with SNARE-associated domain